MADLTREQVTNLLIEHKLIQRAAMEDPEGYDRGGTVRAVEAFCEALGTPRSATGTHPAVQALMAYEQADEEGVMVKVSRQAVDEVVAMLAAAPQQGRAVHYERAPQLDKRISNGDDFAGDAWVRWTAVGQSPSTVVEAEAHPPVRLSDGYPVARLFHDTYERLAPQFGYETRPDTKEFDPTTPNGKLMTAVCAEVLRVVREADALHMKPGQGNG